MNRRIPIVFALLSLGAVGHLGSRAAAAPEASSPSAARGGGQRHGHLEQMVQTLGLTEEQKGKITPILQDEGRQMRALRANTALSAEDRWTKARDLHQATLAQLRPLLTADQQKKLEAMGPGSSGGRAGENGLRSGGRRGMNLEQLDQALTLTADQKTKVSAILDAQRGQMQTMRQNSTLSAQDRRTKMRDLREATRTQIRGMLTADQQKKLDDLHGPRPDAAIKSAKP